MLGATGYGLLAAVGFAAGSLVTKRLVVRFRFDQLIGPAFALNAMWLLPFVSFATWRWSWVIVALHLASIVSISLTSWVIFDLFRHGAASAVTTAQATSPLTVVLGVALLVPPSFSWIETAVAVTVVAAVMAVLRDSFPSIGRGRAWVLSAAVAGGTGMTTVFARLLIDEGVGVVEIYLTRTVIAAMVFLAICPPVSLGRKAIPLLLLRSVLMSAAWSSSILGLAAGSPTVVQTMTATTPLWVMSYEFVRSGTPPPRRVLLTAVLVASAVFVVVLA